MNDIFQTTDPIDFSFNSEYEPEFKFYDQTLLESVHNNNVHTHNFFRLLALCHTVMPADKNGRLEYQAQSPDEAALVSAARNFGFVFRERSPNTITIEVMGKVEVSSRNSFFYCFPISLLMDFIFCVSSKA